MHGTNHRRKQAVCLSPVSVYSLTNCWKGNTKHGTICASYAHAWMRVPDFVRADIACVGGHMHTADYFVHELHAAATARLQLHRKLLRHVQPHAIRRRAAAKFTATKVTTRVSVSSTRRGGVSMWGTHCGVVAGNNKKSTGGEIKPGNAHCDRICIAACGLLLQGAVAHDRD